jgi:hypothetical protein
MMVSFTLLPPCVQQPSVGAAFHTWTFPDGILWTEFHRLDGGYLLRFPSLADFEISADARTVTGFPVPEVPEGTLRQSPVLE